ncbi:DUF4268 domain-containing protein [Micromonospora sp. BL1]|uniref:DUF4268 domain-containing protein n=1 Tax=Micromonospora sp. BL1 TaxID=2478709 RepID=UPI000EF5E786|nr:DUF4268 domain-containing protein [Micromonospora sp. BL1]RLQ01026.1 DUF4268 domain-containing protein [Micromonospora sp. BL1]
MFEPTRSAELIPALVRWSPFEPLAKQRGWTNASAPGQNWWTMPTGSTDATWGVSYALFGCRSELFFGHPDPAVNLARWQVLSDRKAEIMGAFGGELIFDDLPNNKGRRIEARLIGPKIGDQRNWPEVIDWMIDSQERLRQAVAAVGGVPGMVAPTATAGDSDATAVTAEDARI